MFCNPTVGGVETGFLGLLAIESSLINGLWANESVCLKGGGQQFRERDSWFSSALHMVHMHVLPQHMHSNIYEIELSCFKTLQP